MQEQIITLYCLCADFLRAFGVEEDPQARMTTAEVMTVALVGASHFHGNQERARLFLRAFGFIPANRMLSRGRFNRRLHAIDADLWQTLFCLLAQMHKAANEGQEYLIDSMPVPACDNYRIRRCRLYPVDGLLPCRGRIASKKRFFYGLRVHLVVTATGKPVEFFLAPGATADVSVFQEMPLDLPEGAHLFADAGYTDYVHEDILEEAGIHLLAARKKNSKRPMEGWAAYILGHVRKRVETTFSLIERELPRHIHAVTPRGFELKVFLTVLAYSINCCTA